MWWKKKLLMCCYSHKSVSFEGTFYDLLHLLNDHLQSPGNGRSHWDTYNMFLCGNEVDEWLYINHHSFYSVLQWQDASSQCIFIKSVSRGRHYFARKNVNSFKIRDISMWGSQWVWAQKTPLYVHIKLLLFFKYLSLPLHKHATMQTNGTKPELETQCIPSQTSHPNFWACAAERLCWVAQVSVHRNKEEERGVLSTVWMKEIIRGILGCFIGRRQRRILEENIAELSMCFFREGERDCLNWE